MAINKELLEKVKAHILEEPRRYEQSTFAVASEESPCNTVACIGGWAAHLSGVLSLTQMRRSARIRDIARDALGFTDEEADIVFHATGLLWPDKFFALYRTARGREARARAAADYIDHIIATGKVTD